MRTQEFLRLFCCLLLFAAAMCGPVGRAESAEPPVARLITELRSDDATVRRRAAASLGELGLDAVPAIAELRRAMQDREPNVRIAAMTSLGRIGPAASVAAPDLFAAIDDRSVGDDLRPVWTYAATAIGQLGPQTVPQLISWLESSELQHRRAAAVALHELGREAARAVPAIVQVLAENEPATRIPMIYALRGIGPPAAPAVPLLIEQLSSDDFHTQYWACRAIGSIGTPAARQAVPRLLKVLHDGAPSVRRNAAAAIGAIGPSAGPEVVPALAQALGDPTVPVRREAAAALGKLGPAARAALPALESVLDQRAFGARSHAALAIWQVSGKTDQPLRALLAELSSPHAPWEAAQVLAAMGSAAKPALGDLIALTNSQRAETRLYAIGALAAVAGGGSKSTRDAMRSRLDDEDPDVRSAAQQALKQLRPPKS